MRRAAKIDSNQASIVKALRQIPHCSVQSLAATGKGVPDLLVGYAGRNYLMEIKRPKLSPSKGLTTAERDWLFSWCGQCAVVYSVDGALAVIGVA